jgi:uncharacterized protein (TIGR03066 family)
MSICRSLAVLVLLFLPATIWCGDDQKPAKASELIIGVWTGVKGWETSPDLSMQFEKSGTFKLLERKGESLTKGNKKIAAETVTVASGSYTIKGQRLTMSAKVDGKEVTDSRTIKTLTDKTLILVNDEGKTSEYRRAK